jgi:hypothetical protein
METEELYRGELILKNGNPPMLKMKRECKTVIAHELKL